MEKVVAGEGFAPVVPPTVPQYPEGYVRDPPYAMAKYSPTESNFTRGSIASWGNAAPANQPARQSTATKRSTSSDIAPLNIEDMLNYAANRSSSQRTPDARSSFGNLVTPRTVPARAYMRPDADVPEDPTSIAMSFYPSGLLRASSTNTTHLSHAASSIWGVLPPPPAASGLPSSPRDTLNRHPPSLGGVSADGFLRPDAYIQTGSARDSVSSWGNDRGIAR
ncbi:hypothetical protein CPB85DRAFT_1559148 [Mucidula mucida]|nr:hypothetical protein CPB85DRAFT_1559148 [Mucidula mucida]